MAAESDGVTNSQVLRRDLLQHTLASWRYFLLFAIPPLLWAMFIAPPGVMRGVIVLLCGSVFFGCWRIWLDARYFTLITQENNDQAGEALFFIWRRARLRELTLTERQQGALKQLRLTLVAVAATWVMLILALVA
ncbi:hypothetical protein [Klebsiella spallanzanii]|uniref:hypothetical protein n=1 Tax=Klebsiella spallanzanii TaxID=2587528 RepID=UPI00115902D2|nr:hypothetical protein [Klebsiella spallanzanii]VUS54713.1 hypothetical protein SB6419_00741 [Klebsiella spallanzanii]